MQLRKKDTNSIFFLYTRWIINNSKTCKKSKMTVYTKIVTSWKWEINQYDLLFDIFHPNENEIGRV